MSVLGTVSDSEDSMVERGSARGSSQDSASVLLEDGPVGFNSDRGWLGGNSSFELRSVVVCNIGVSANPDSTLAALVSAAKESMGFGNVWIISLSLKRIRFGIKESTVWHTTIAA